MKTDRTPLIDALKCPICGSTISQQDQTLVCTKNHCFDISRKGYVNLTLGAAQSKYDKALFTSRRVIHQLGFFAPLVEAIVQVINEHTKNKQLILDAGCGEGSLLNDVCTRISLPGIGIDIAKDGVRMAAKHYKEQLWLCADLARMPIQDNSIDIILNILSPANYQEFSRILRPDGLLIKAIPGADHLRELRQTLNENSEYSNEEVHRLYREHYPDTVSIEIRHTVPLDAVASSHLVRMTPLSWSRGVDEGKASSITEATLHVVLLVSKI